MRRTPPRLARCEETARAEPLEPRLLFSGASPGGGSPPAAGLVAARAVAGFAFVARHPPRPATPAGLVARPLSPTRVRLTWQDPAGDETGFRLERSTTRAFTSLKIIPVANPSPPHAVDLAADHAVHSAVHQAFSYSDHGLSAATTYYYRVAAVNVVARSAHYSEIATARTSAPAGGLRFNVLFDDQAGGDQAYFAPVRDMLQAAGDDWASHLAAVGTVNLNVIFTTAVPRAATSGGGAVVPIGRAPDGKVLVEEGVPYQLATGRPPSGAPASATLLVNPTFARDELWFDPDPHARTAPVPADRTDAYSVFVHELTHILGFNGQRDGKTGLLAAGEEETFDRWVVNQGGTLFFTGPHAVAAFGGEVPLTYGNYSQIGNDPPRPGNAQSNDDLMNGLRFFRGHRYSISSLDLAILKDVGDPIV